jgi:hypothetical protein
VEGQEGGGIGLPGAGHKPIGSGRNLKPEQEVRSGVDFHFSVAFLLLSFRDSVSASEPSRADKQGLEPPKSSPKQQVSWRPEVAGLYPQPFLLPAS